MTEQQPREFPDLSAVFAHISERLTRTAHISTASLAYRHLLTDDPDRARQLLATLPADILTEAGTAAGLLGELTAEAIAATTAGRPVARRGRA